MVDFARPASELHKPRLGDIDPRANPSASKGYALDTVGHIPLIQETGETWREEIVAVSVDLPNTSAHAGNSMNVTVPGLAVGDYCELVGRGNVGRTFHAWTDFVCATAETIVLQYYNADTSGLDPGAGTMYFRVTHRVP